jgi:drug/metabolite transporter (DMT)-like permease
LIPLSGAVQVVLAGILFALMGAGVKLLSPTQPNSVIVFFRNAFALLVFVPWVIHRGIGSLRTGVPQFHLLRGLAGLSAMYCFFFAIGRLELAGAVLLNYTLPLFMPLIAWVWLKEPLTRTIGLAVGLGFLGVLLVVKPGTDLFQPAALVGLCAGVLGALAQVTIRRLTRTEPVLLIVFYFSLITTIVSAVPVPWSELHLGRTELMILAVVGLLAAAAQILLTRGYASAPAASVGPFIYSSVVFAGILDWLFWNHVPGLYSLLGTLLICLGGILVMRASLRRFSGIRSLP